MKRKMSMLGIGLYFAFISLIYLSIVMIIDHYTDPLFKIDLLPNEILYITGMALLLFGIPYYVLCAVTIRKAYNRDSLCTTGVYSTCRHPLYSTWIFFIIPGIVLFFRSWILLSLPLVMYVILLLLAGKEEKYLEKRFGDEYSTYKERTNFAFPKLWRFSKQ